MAKLIIRNRYGVIPDELLNNPNISLKAKGLYGYLQSKPDGWKFSAKKISFQSKEGVDAIRRTLQELERFGYLKRRLAYDKQKKRISGYDYILYSKPIIQKTNPIENQSIGFSDNLSNIDNSNIDIVRKNKNIAKQSFAGEGKKINDLIKLFEPINPSYEKLFKNKTQRQALTQLLRRYGEETLTMIINTLTQTNSMKFAPVITTPLELEKKLGKLIAFVKRKKSENKINTTII